jgi:beta-fructofuranosidase
MYFLKAPRSIGDPTLRHVNVSIGHATSDDLMHWTEAPDALAPAASPAFDDAATWTGSVIRSPGGIWCMFYTGCTRSAAALKQRIGLATSTDLHTWQRHPASPVLESDSRWYEQLGPRCRDEAWRDPWVFADPGGDGWHMLVTARARRGGGRKSDGQRAVVGHARSRDLVTWQAQPPLSQPGTGFWHLEVQQVEVVEGRLVLLFSCLPAEVSGPRRAAGPVGAIWCVPGASVTGPFDTRRAVPVADQDLYSGRLIRDRAGRWVMLAFRNVSTDGFVGEITDPMPVSWTEDGTALIARPAGAAVPPGTRHGTLLRCSTTTRSPTRRGGCWRPSALASRSGSCPCSTRT